MTLHQKIAKINKDFEISMRSAYTLNEKFRGKLDRLQETISNIDAINSRTRAMVGGHKKFAVKIN